MPDRIAELRREAEELRAQAVRDRQRVRTERLTALEAAHAAAGAAAPPFNVVDWLTQMRTAQKAEMDKSLKGIRDHHQAMMAQIMAEAPVVAGAAGSGPKPMDYQQIMEGWHANTGAHRLQTRQLEQAGEAIETAEATIQVLGADLNQLKTDMAPLFAGREPSQAEIEAAAGIVGADPNGRRKQALAKLYLQTQQDLQEQKAALAEAQRNYLEQMVAMKRDLLVNLKLADSRNTLEVRNLVAAAEKAEELLEKLREVGGDASRLPASAKKSLEAHSRARFANLVQGANLELANDKKRSDFFLDVIYGRAVGIEDPQAFKAITTVNMNSDGRAEVTFRFPELHETSRWGILPVLFGYNNAWRIRQSRADALAIMNSGDGFKALIDNLTARASDPAAGGPAIGGVAQDDGLSETTRRVVDAAKRIIRQLKAKGAKKLTFAWQTHNGKEQLVVKQGGKTRRATDMEYLVFLRSREAAFQLAHNKASVEADVSGLQSAIKMTEGRVLGVAREHDLGAGPVR